MTRQRELDLIRERHAAGRFDSAPDHDAVTFLLAEVDRLTAEIESIRGVASRERTVLLVDLQNATRLGDQLSRSVRHLLENFEIGADDDGPVVLDDSTPCVVALAAAADSWEANR